MSDDLVKPAAAAPYTVTPEEYAAIAAAIDSEELVALALELGNIPSTSGNEAASGAYVHDWLRKEGFNPRSVGATPQRQNIIGEYGGEGDGASLLFTAHLDTESPSYDADIDSFKLRAETLENRQWLECWREGDTLFGYPLTNDRGPMSCFMIAAKALRKANIKLAGKLYLTACPGEIGPEPVEQFRGVEFMGKDIGANYLFHHGGVAPDYAIAAEGTDYGVTWQGCGYAVIRIRLLGKGNFTPVLEHPADPHQHPNPIYRLGPVIAALHAWGIAYEKKNRYESGGGVSVPKVQIDAIRGGAPHTFGIGTDIVALYLEVGLTARQQVGAVRRELVALMRTLDLDGFEVEPVVVRHGYEADAAAVGPLVAAVCAATEQVLETPAVRAHPVYSSMWRDHNVFNMQRIPAITTGMPRDRPTRSQMAKSALIYALTALAVCGRHIDRDSAA
jgi:acetylornithine deacetylase/succinyl-diaminopimelate desuccinylase-like protein